MTTGENPYTIDLNVDWETFEEALLGLQDLEWVMFQTETERDGYRTTAECAQPLEDEWRTYLEEHLPTIKARGLLRFLE